MCIFSYSSKITALRLYSCDCCLYSFMYIIVCFSDHNLLTWTDSAVYIFTPHTGQVLLWTKIKGKKHASKLSYKTEFSLLLNHCFRPATNYFQMS